MVLREALAASVPPHVELIAPHYSWDTGTFASSSSSSLSQAPGSVNLIHDEDDLSSHIAIPAGSEYPQEEHRAAFIVESLLARVRNVGYSLVAPDSVHKAVRSLVKRKALTPGNNLSRRRERGLNRRAERVLDGAGPAPATVNAAEDMLNQFQGFGPHAQVVAPGTINAAVSIGTAAAGGVHSRNEAPLQEPFSVFLPPPYRILFLIALGLLCWSANLRGLRRLGLDADGLMSSEAKMKVLPHHRVRGEQLTSGASIISSQSSLFSSQRTVGGPAESEVAIYFRQAGPQETAAFHLGLLCFIWTTVCWIAYRLYAFHTIFYGGDQIGGFASARGRHAQAIQSIAVFGVCVVAVWPGDVAYRSMRKALGKQLALVCLPSLNQPIHFPQVLFADILTSFARVFGDLWLTMCFLWPKSDTPAWWNGKGSIAVPILVSLPYAIRLRQCLSEYNVSQKGVGKRDASLKPLYNALKYASAFPVIWLSVMQGRKAVSHEEEVVGEASTSFYLWILSVFVNSFFSFWWDVTNDWGLEMLKWETWMTKSTMMAQGVRTLHRKTSSSFLAGVNGNNKSNSSSDVNLGKGANEAVGNGNGNGHPHSRPHHMLTVPSPTNGGNNNSHIAALGGHTRSQSSFLRAPEQVMLFPPIVYQLAVTCDLILRFAWSLKLSSHLHHIIELESTAFYLEAMEILRRWAWTFLRVEWEACKRKSWEAEGSMESLTLSTLRSDSQAYRDDVSCCSWAEVVEAISLLLFR